MMHGQSYSNPNIATRVRPLARDYKYDTAVVLEDRCGNHYLCIEGTKKRYELEISAESAKQISSLTNYEKKSEVEIEGKWRLKSFAALAAGFDLSQATQIEITQGYLLIDFNKTEVRVRSEQTLGVIKYTLTLKSGGDLLRGEVCIEISREQFDSVFLSFVNGRVIDKTRYQINYHHAVIEADRYRRAGPQQAHGGYLPEMTAEVEFPTVDAHAVFFIPPCFGDEVTKVPGFKNQKLAVNGFP